MRTLGNILWFLLGGAIMGLSWMIISLICFITIIGIPWGRACFVIGKFSFWPFGLEAIERSLVSEGKDVGSGAFGVVGNIIWFIFAGFGLALTHIFFALSSFLTIVGIPFGIQHVKLAGLAILPIGKTIVPKDVAVAARKAHIDRVVAAAQNKA